MTHSQAAAERGEFDIAEAQHTYDVEFFNKDGGVGAHARVESPNVITAIKAAGVLRAEQIINGASWGTKVTLVDVEAEAEECRVNAHMYDLAEVATRLFDTYGFRENSGWWKHERSGLYASVDSHQAGFGNRFAGIFQHQIIPGNKNVMAAFALIPWYGDGADPSVAEDLLDRLLQEVTK